MPPNQDPYTPPKTSVVNPHLESATLGYRDGDLLMAKENFIGPKVCVITGQEANKSTPIPVKLKSKTPWQDLRKPYPLGMLLICLGIPVYLLHDVITDFSNLGWFTLFPVAIMAYVFPSIIDSQRAAIHVFCSNNILKQRKRRKTYSLILSLTGVISLFIFPRFTTPESYNLIWISIALILSSSLLNDKKVLKPHPRQGGEYQPFSGAHPNFLQALQNPSKN